MDPQDQNEHHAERDLPKRWLDRHLWQIQPVRDLLVIAAVFGIFWLGYKLSVVTVPLLLAVTLAYVFEPLIKRMTRAEWMSRQGAAAAIIALIFLHSAYLIVRRATEELRAQHASDLERVVSK